ncbi:MAG: amidohydrolase family protein [Clostridia bacterium]|nr:amidohydrolase family protein [Clostridia bacterium]
MKIIANHAHLFQPEVREVGTMQALESLMEECHIDQAVCFAPFTANYKDTGINQNRWLYEQIKNKDKFFGFGTIDFSKDNLKEQTEEIYQLGLNGIKMHPAFQKFKVDGDRACQVYEVAEKYGLPISFHTGVHWYRISHYNTLLYDEVAYRFPELKICMEHVGGYSFFNEALAVMCNNPGRIYAGLTSVFTKDYNIIWYLGKEKVKDLLWLTGVEQSVFGLDFPYNDAQKTKVSIKELNDCIDEMQLGEEAKEKVFGGNLLSMIKR